MKRNNVFNSFCIGLFVTVSLLSFFDVQLATVFYWNHSASEPVGIYMAVPGDVKRGDKVVMHVPPEMRDYCYGRGWMQPDESMLKTVLGLEGDTYNITDDAIYVGVAKIGKVSKTDLTGLDLPQITGEHTIAQDRFLAIGTNKNESFDGRYFGDQPKSLIVTRVIPILCIPEDWL